MIDFQSCSRPRIEKGKFFFLCAVICIAVFLYAPTYAENDPNSKPDGETYDVTESAQINRIIPSKPNDLFVVLENGLVVLIRESHGSPVISCRVLVNTGSMYEGKRMQGGLSHYLEHVVSGGTTSELTETQIQERLQAIGGATNASTGYRHTVYFIKTTGAHYKEALSLLLAYVSDCQFNETEYEREKGVILQEYQMGENSPSHQLWHLFMKTAYLEHPVRYPVIGNKEIFMSMDKEDLEAHYRRWYTPENMVVSVVGAVDKKAVLETVLELAENMKRTSNPPYVLPAEPAQLTERRVEKSLPMARTTQAKVGFRTVTLADPDLYPLDVLAVIMGDGRTSRLYENVRDKKGLVLSISAWSWTPVFTEGQFFVSMDLAYDDLSEAIDAVLAEVSAVQKKSVSEEALTRAKNKVAANYIFSQESVQSQAGQLASDWVATGDPYFSEEYVSKIQEVTRQDLTRVAEKYLRREHMTIAVIKPPGDSSKAPGSTAPTSGVQPEIHKITLPNQMVLLLQRNTAAPIVDMKFVVRGGLRFEPIDKPGLSQFMASLLTKGTRNRSKMQIAEAIEDVGGSIGSGSGHNTVSVSVSVLKEHFDVGLDLLSDVVLHPTFPQAEIKKQRRETLMAIEKLDENWTTEIMRLFKRHYYHEHPYRNDVIGSSKAVESFSRGGIKDLYEAVMMPNNSVLAIFGDIDPETVKASIEKAFEGFRPAVLEEPIIGMETENIVQDETFGIVNEKTSAAMVVGYNGMTLTDRDRPVVDVIDAIISGIRYPSGWLHDALRGGDRSLVYVVHAYPSFGVDGGYFGIMVQTTLDNYDAVVEAIQSKMALIQEKEVAPETLERAKAMCITAQELGLEKISSQASSAATNEILGLGYDYERLYPGFIKSVSPAEVLRVAKKLFSNRLIVSTKPEQLKIED
ncbi:MAG: insulinase family protein [Deltaproteobacteria bacterium]|nr:insulinase family protein [Deltaproteobacteria bacterium]